MLEPLKLGRKKVLVGVSSVGLGHVKRSLLIVKSLRRLRPEVEAEWVCAQPACAYLESVGERLVYGCDVLESLSAAFEENRGGAVDALASVRRAYEQARRNYARIRDVVASYDLIIQDEFLETLLAHRWEEYPALPPKRVAVTDFVDVGGAGLNPARWVTAWYAGRLFRQSLMRCQLRIFADDLEAAPPGLRPWIQRRFIVTGPIVSLGHGDGRRLREQTLASSADGKLVCFTIGGTSVGRRILDLAWENRVELCGRLNATLLFLTGPRVNPDSYMGDPVRVKVIGFTPYATDWFDASDCVVTQAGASTLNELEALGKPTVCIPIQGHWEQQRNSRRFNNRAGFVPLEPSDLSADTLVESVQLAMNSQVTQASMPERETEPATLAAQGIAGLLD